MKNLFFGGSNFYQKLTENKDKKLQVIEKGQSVEFWKKIFYLHNDGHDSYCHDDSCFFVPLD